MFFAKTLALATLLSAACVSAFPDLATFARNAENDIYARDMAEMGLTRREEHPSPDMVRREVEDLVRRAVPELLTRMPHVVCRTILDECTSSAECRKKSSECTYCGPDSKCAEKGPESHFSSDSSTNSGGSSSRHGSQNGGQRGSQNGGQRGSQNEGQRVSEKERLRGSQRGGKSHK